MGQRKYIYANDLVSLRRKEQELLKAQLDGLDVYTAGNASINFVFDRYISLKQHLKDSTRSGYIYTYNHFVRKDFGKKKIADIKYSVVVPGMVHGAVGVSIGWGGGGCGGGVVKFFNYARVW